MANKKLSVVLGVNGWPQRSHDASAALMIGGRIVAMAEEERFTRKKHAFDSFPIRAIHWCLAEGKISLDDVDEIAVGWDYPKLYRVRHLQNPVSNRPGSVLFPPKYFSYRRLPPITYVDHHLAHASAAFYASGFLDAAIIVVDGQGELASTTIAYGYAGGIRIIDRRGIKDSLGFFYEAVSEFIGLGAHSAGKLMGLAPYGNAKRYFTDLFRPTHNGYEVALPGQIVLGKSGPDEQAQIKKIWYQYFRLHLRLQPNTPKPIFSKSRSALERRPDLRRCDRDLAASAQMAVERIVLHLSQVSAEKTGSKNLVISGGVGLNCSANGKVIRSGLFKQYYFFPAANDAGVSYGAAAWRTKQLSRKSRIQAVTSANWGPRFSTSEIKRYLKTQKISFQQHQNTIEKIAAKLITQGAIIGWIQGRMEIGPRALGQRSILADPRDRRNHFRVNAIKSREQWRPLAPSVMAGHEKDYFTSDYRSPFMLMSSIARSDQRSKIPAVVHIDGSSRYQSVTPSGNSRFYRLLQEFYRLTGIPMLLNTSFNTQDEPIVCSPHDAIRTFFSTSLDVLIMEDIIVYKQRK